jgi:hypothetical protein
VLAHIGAFISKQVHYKTPFLHNGYMKSLEFYEKLHNSILSGKNNVMLRFMEQALQIPLLCSSTVFSKV